MESFPEFWTRVTASDEILAVVLTAMLALVATLFRLVVQRRARLRWGVTHDLVSLPTGDDGKLHPVRSRRIWVGNYGSATAEEVEVIFNWRPQVIEQFPHLATSEEVKQDGRYIATIPRLNPGEGLALTMLAFDANEIPPVIYCRGKGVPGKQIQFESIVKLPRPAKFAIGLVMLLGVIASFYLIIRLVGLWFFGGL